MDSAALTRSPEGRLELLGLEKALLGESEWVVLCILCFDHFFISLT